MELLDLDRLPAGTRIRVLRLVAQLSARGLADRWGRSEAYVYRLEAGEREPTPLEAADIVKAAEAALDAPLMHAEPPHHAVTNGAQVNGVEFPRAAAPPGGLADALGDVADARAARREPDQARRRRRRGSS